MSHGEDEKRSGFGGKVVDLTSRLRIEDTTSRMATELISVFERYKASPVEYFTALAVASQALRSILEEAGMPPEVFKDLLLAAKQNMERYQTRNR